MWIEVTARELLLIRSGAHTKFMEYEYKIKNKMIADDYANLYKKATSYWNKLSAEEQMEVIEK